MFIQSILISRASNHLGNPGLENYISAILFTEYCGFISRTDVKATVLIFYTSILAILELLWILSVLIQLKVMSSVEVILIKC